MIYQTDKTRLKILQQAERCFSESGFFQTQMKDIAEAVGMSRNTLYRYYRDKFELGFAILESVLKHKYRDVEDQLELLLNQSGLDVRHSLGELFNRMYVEDTAEVDDRFIAEFDAFYSGERIPEDFRERLSAAAGDSFFDSLNRLVERGQAEGSIRSDIEPHILSTTLSNAIQAFHQRMILRNSALIELDIGVPSQMTPVLIQILIDGVKPDSKN
jgi:AcrR family transcriptional regulator